MVWSSAWGSVQEKYLTTQNNKQNPLLCGILKKEPNKECHDAETNDQVPQEHSTVEDKSTTGEDMELGDDTHVHSNKGDSTMKHVSTGAD